MISDRRWFLADDRETVVGEDDPRAAFLLCGVGALLPDGYVFPTHESEKPEATHIEKPSTSTRKKAGKPAGA